MVSIKLLEHSSSVFSLSVFFFFCPLLTFSFFRYFVFSLDSYSRLLHVLSFVFNFYLPFLSKSLHFLLVSACRVLSLGFLWLGLTFLKLLMSANLSCLLSCS